MKNNKYHESNKEASSSKTRIRPQQDQATVIKPQAPNPLGDRKQDKQQKIDSTQIQQKTQKTDPDKTQSLKTQSLKTDALTTQAPTIDAHQAIGKTIRGRFVLEKLLGEGGMGSVYRALDLRKQEAGDEACHIAIKILNDAFKDHPHAFISLQREAKKTQALAHPNIVTVYDFDRDGDLVFLTMEELKGSSLDQIILNKGPQHYSSKIRLDLIRQIAEGLAYAHQQGIVHSDLKPGNIIVTDKNRVKILDFGIARAASEHESQDSVGQAGFSQDSFDAGVLGALTPAYASPEMFDRAAPKSSDDIYALGIIACELLAAVHPFNGETAENARNRNMIPKLPKNSSFLLKKLLKHALTFKRSERIPSGEVFLKKLNFVQHGAKRLAAIAVLVFAVLIGNLAYLQFKQQDTIPFSSLTAEQQTQFHKHIQEGQQALTFSDVDGAVYYFNQAYLIHRTHNDIVQAKEKVLTLYLEKLRNEGENKAFAMQQIQALSQYPLFEDDAKLDQIRTSLEE